MSEIPAVQAIGATEVIPAEFEASSELFVCLLAGDLLVLHGRHIAIAGALDLL